MSAQLRYLDVTAHELIAKTALGLAEEIYETLCSGSNAIYKVNANRRDFLKQCAPTLRPVARSTLAAMLNDPKISTREKDLIHDALCLDAMLPRTGTSMVRKGYGQ